MFIATTESLIIYHLILNSGRIILIVFCFLSFIVRNLVSMDHKAVTKIISVKQAQGEGFLVRKVIGGTISSCDPFIMLDHIGK